MTSSDQLSSFELRRNRLDTQLEAARVVLDDFFIKHELHSLTLADIANLEGRLEVRRDLLRQLVALDDAFMDAILELRKSVASGDGAAT